METARPVSRLVLLWANNRPFAWGDNDSGQLGDNTSGTDRLVPEAVTATGVLAGKTVVSTQAARCGVFQDDRLPAHTHLTRSAVRGIYFLVKILSSESAF